MSFDVITIFAVCWVFFMIDIAETINSDLGSDYIILVGFKRSDRASLIKVAIQSN